MGATSPSVCFANDSDQDVYVIASLNSEWPMMDFLVDPAWLNVAATELQAAVATDELESIELPKALSTIEDLYNFTKIAGLLVHGTMRTGYWTAEAALSLIKAFKETGKKISKKNCTDVLSYSMLNYFHNEGSDAFLEATTVSVMVMSDDGKQSAMWNTGSNDSWISTRSKEIVRSKPGSIWQKDPESGTVNWPAIK